MLIAVWAMVNAVKAVMAGPPGCWLRIATGRVYWGCGCVLQPNSRILPNGGSAHETEAVGTPGMPRGQVAGGGRRLVDADDRARRLLRQAPLRRVPRQPRRRPEHP